MGYLICPTTKFYLRPQIWEPCGIGHKNWDVCYGFRSSISVCELFQILIIHIESYDICLLANVIAYRICYIIYGLFIMPIKSILYLPILNKFQTQYTKYTIEGWYTKIYLVARPSYPVMPIKSYFRKKYVVIPN